MILLKAVVNNFGSYKELNFDFSSTGLALVYGHTGSGKSTLQDISLWILYGITAKNGNVDEVKSWHNPSQPTTGELDVITKSGESLHITRIRGTSKQNDLLLFYHNQTIRGKDITETQELLEHLLGVSKETYLLSVCYNEFSSTSNFFTAKAKERRELFEGITNLSLPIAIIEESAKERSKLKKELDGKKQELSFAEGKLKQAESGVSALETALATWEQKHQQKIQAIKNKMVYFEQTKEKELKKLIDFINDIEGQPQKELICRHCGQRSEAAVRTRSLLMRSKEDLLKLHDSTNPHIEELKTVETSEENSYKAQLSVVKTNIFQTTIQRDMIKDLIRMINESLNDLEHLADLSLQLRSILLSNIIGSIQNETNRILETYFDGILSVTFIFDGADNLNINIYKNGYECVYKQLSKGQRNLLKLSFSLAIMKAAANKAGVHFQNLFFDEALDGLDDALKLKAFGLFSELSLKHNNILLIDHNEQLKNLFSEVYHVTMQEDMSLVTHE